MNAFFPDGGTITNNMFSDVIFNKLVLWRGIPDNFALRQIRCETIGLATQAALRIRQDIRCLISKKNVFL